MRPRTTIGRVVLGAVTLALATAACGDDDSGDAEAFCTTATDSTRFESMIEGLDPADVDGAIATFRAARDAEEDLLNTAPAAVQADVSVLVRFFDDLVEGLESTEATSSARPPIYDELKPRFDQVEAASIRVELYVETNCDSPSR